MVLAMMRRQDKPLSELAACMAPFPQSLVSVRVARKPALETLPPVQKAIRDVEKRMGGKGRVLVRYSGTEPKARILVEGENPKVTEQAAQAIADALIGAIGAR